MTDKTIGAVIDEKFEAIGVSLTFLNERISAVGDGAANAIDALKTRVDESDEALASLDARVKALEEGAAPTPEPEPEPEPGPAPVPWRMVYSSAEFVSGALDIDEIESNVPFNIIVLAEDGVTGPVMFYVDGDEFRREVVPAYCLFGGDAAHETYGTLPEGTHEIRIETPGFAPAVFTLVFSAAPGGDPDPQPDPEPDPDLGDIILPDGPTQFMFDPWGIGSSNTDAPLANIFRGSAADWFYDGPGGTPLTVEEIDERGFPLPNSTGKFVSNYFFGVHPEVKDDWAGDWVFVVEGDVEKIWAGLTPGAHRIDPKRVEWTWTEATSNHAFLAELTNVGPAGVTDMFVGRAEDEARHRAGLIASAGFIERCEPEDVIRVMDIQSQTETFIARADDVPPYDYYFWGNTAQFTGPDREGYKGTPPELEFRLGVETGNAIWRQSPAKLGYPGAQTKDPVELTRVARENASAIIASPEFDKYGERVVTDLIRSGYPSKKKLYNGTANEAWNWAFRDTSYFAGLGQGLFGGQWQQARGYGVVFARNAAAIETALKKHGREQDLVHVLETWTGSPEETEKSITAARDFLNANGHDFAALRGRMGIALTTYWGGADNFYLFRTAKGWSEADWQAAEAADPAGLMQEFEDYLRRGADVGCLPWLVKAWDDAGRLAGAYGLMLVGAYEGRSHLIKAPYVSREWYEAFNWGAHGAAVDYDVQTTIAARFPGVILCDYAGYGPKGQPWFERPDGPMDLIWQQARKDIREREAA